ncbi:MAG: hypothetical protein WBA66_07050 [Xanthobacteraceae bacterium]
MTSGPSIRAWTEEATIQTNSIKTDNRFRKPQQRDTIKQVANHGRGYIKM